MKERKLHSLRRLTIWSYDTGDQHWGGAADNKAIHSMLRLHKDHTDTKIAQAGLVQRHGGRHWLPCCSNFDLLLLYRAASASLTSNLRRQPPSRT